MSNVQLRGVGKVYPDGFVAVDGIDLDIADGELFVLVGPSGCGKSTLLRMIAGLESITVGEILVDGERINNVPTNTRNLSMVFQSSALYPHLTVRDNLGFPLKMARESKATIAERVDRVAGLLGLTSQLDARHQALSGGERQRVAMGRAIVGEPELLLMDEPMSNLDAKLRTELRSELLMLQQRLAVTTVYVTHDQVEAMALGDRVAVMRDGVIVQSGAPVDIYNRPKDMFVAQFLGSPPMNLLVGQVADGECGLGLSIGAHLISIADVAADWPGLDRRVGQRIVIGIRPDAFRRDPNGEFVLSLRFHEQVGTTQWIHAVFDGPMIDTTDPEPTSEPTLVAAVEGRDEVSLWKPLHLGVDTTRLHLFDPETGLALRRQPSASTVTGTPLSAMLPLTGS